MYIQYCQHYTCKYVLKVWVFLSTRVHLFVSVFVTDEGLGHNNGQDELHLLKKKQKNTAQLLSWQMTSPWHHQYVLHPVWWRRSPCFGQTVHFCSTGSSRVITKFICDSEPSVMVNVITDVVIYSYEKYCQSYKDQGEIIYLSIGVSEL